MRTSEQCKNVIKAVFEVKKELRPLTKDSNNPFFKSKYLELSDLLIEVEPILHKHGLFLTQGTIIKEGKQIVISRVTHAETAEYIESEFLADTGTHDSQKIGSATSYARRYSIQALLSLNAVDDDANAASDKKVETKASTPAKSGFSKPAQAVAEVKEEAKAEVPAQAAPAAPSARSGSFGKFKQAEAQ